MKTDTTYPEADFWVHFQQAIFTWEELAQKAIASIAEHDLLRFEQILWEQQVFCATLQKLLLVRSPANVPEQDKAQLMSARKQLVLVNRAYGELVQHARRTGGVLYQLCLEYAADRTPGAAATRMQPVEA